VVRRDSVRICKLSDSLSEAAWNLLGYTTFFWKTERNFSYVGAWTKIERSESGQRLSWIPTLGMELKRAVVRNRRN